MKKSAKNRSNNLTAARALSESVGDFMRYWGFRRIHGAIWTQIYLSAQPLSCSDLVKNLKMSKALISPALEELCRYGLLIPAASPNEKTKLYQAEDNVERVILKILKTREAVLLSSVDKHFKTLKSLQVAAPSTPSANELQVQPERLEKLGAMIEAANLMLTILVSQKSLFDLPGEFSGDFAAPASSGGSR